MSKIRIKNFGPIKEGFLDNDGWMDIKKVTMFIGNQGSGKSTVAKLISTFMWMEKALLNGTLQGDEAATNEFVEERCGYFRLKKYIRDGTELCYDGEYCRIDFLKGILIFDIKQPTGLYCIPKIMYVPAERSFLSSVEDAENVSGLPRPLFEFMYENNRSLKELNSNLPIPVGKYSLRYDSFRKVSYILGENYEIELNAASSGLHSAVPLYVVSRNLSEGILMGVKDRSLSDLSFKQQLKRKEEIRNIRIDSILSDKESNEEFQKMEDIIESKFRNSSFVNIVEEPEQNLYPTSQREILYSLLAFNQPSCNKLIMTTHSPYILSYFTSAVKAYKVRSAFLAKGVDYDEEIANIVPINSLSDDNDWAIYEMSESNGTIQILPDFNKLPEDDNLLNKLVSEINNDYGRLRQIEKR